ncbi:hypothetical protein QQZ08_008380 [Neonectria magnoliae]|uniref:Uncharacterized protein n=1 Tax=Neonectria magnoliae TaxID=2732573 RepID=A0ABR1HVY0_9HYPO
MSDVAAECSFGNPLQPWTPDRVAEALAQLASLHGKTWNSNEADYPWLFGKGGEKLANPMRTMILALLRPEPWAVRLAEECRPPVAEPMPDRERMLRAYEALALHADGGPKLAKDDIWDNYRRHTLHGFLWAMTPLKMQPEAIVFAITDRYSTAIVDHKTLDLLEDKEESICAAVRVIHNRS